MENLEWRMQNGECRISSHRVLVIKAFSILHSPFSILHSTSCIQKKAYFTMRPVLYLFPLLLVLAGCDSFSEQKLFGHWRGAGVLENGVPLDIDPAEIHFEFCENGKYTFQSTLNYREAGTFKMADGLLYTLDTINQASSEKAVKVVKLSGDSLCLEMMTAGKIRMLKLVRGK